ncbi:hypothetical protein K2173_011848 [Erythroxylum novogranatense]|uniref:Uncharacterized protein n=1 Tax=Erythroxylum novogranatense TaxID=1862640 RepID=A0AAV8SM03_9ROSI|nr:hypothetical protein K2173_011848 [Erythroxylum novogranatense]
MAAPTFKTFTLCCFFFVVFLTLHCPITQAHVNEKSNLKLLTDAVEWPFSAATYGVLDEEDDGDDGLDDLDGDEGKIDRRSLFWRGFHYYISYGALSANRIPCPPRSGRSYYTHNCFKARTPVTEFFIRLEHDQIKTI